MSKKLRNLLQQQMTSKINFVKNIAFKMTDQKKSFSQRTQRSKTGGIYPRNCFGLQVKSKFQDICFRTDS